MRKPCRARMTEANRLPILYHRQTTRLPPATERQVVEQAHQGDQTAKHRLIEGRLLYIMHMATRHHVYAEHEEWDNTMYPVLSVRFDAQEGAVLTYALLAQFYKELCVINANVKKNEKELQHPEPIYSSQQHRIVFCLEYCPVTGNWLIRHNRAA